MAGGNGAARDRVYRSRVRYCGFRHLAGPNSLGFRTRRARRSVCEPSRRAHIRFAAADGLQQGPLARVQRRRADDRQDRAPASIVIVMRNSMLARLAETPAAGKPRRIATGRPRFRLPRARGPKSDARVCASRNSHNDTASQQSQNHRAAARSTRETAAAREIGGSRVMVFKTGRAEQPSAWKVRFLRRSVRARRKSDEAAIPRELGEQPRPIGGLRACYGKAGEAAASLTSASACPRR